MEKNNYSSTRIQTLQIGGGIGSLIGESHRIAMHMDNKFELVGGVFNRNHQKTIQMAQQLDLDINRAYATVSEMLEAEKGRATCVSICTPNDTHFAYSKAALEAGYHVICDKPLAMSSKECETLQALAKAQNRVLSVTYNYSGYPMVREAQARIAKGDLGRLLIINVQMPQSALSALKQSQGEAHPRMQWRMALAESGKSMILLDLMTHVIHLAEYVADQSINQVSAFSSSLNNDRGIEDDVVLSCKWSNGAVGQLWSSCVATGNEHGLAFSIYGEKASLHWQQAEANSLTIKHVDTTETKVTRASQGLSDFTQAGSRLLNHPEGFFEAFANIYAQAAQQILASQAEEAPPRDSSSQNIQRSEFAPDGTDAARGIKVLEAAEVSIKKEGAWAFV